MSRHSQPRLIFLLLFVAGVLSVLYYPYNASFNPAPLLVGVSFLCLPFLVAVEGSYVVSGRVRKRELPLVFAFGIAATLVSAFFTTAVMPAEPCALGVSGSGFPLPWYITFTQYVGPDRIPCQLILDPAPYWRAFTFFSFLFDTIFYAGLAMTRNEIYGWAKERTAARKRSPRESQGKKLDNNEGDA
jgi:hypothetical protein